MRVIVGVTRPITISTRRAHSDTQSECYLLIVGCSRLLSWVCKPFLSEASMLSQVGHSRLRRTVTDRAGNSTESSITLPLSD